MERRNFFRTLGLALAGSALIPHEQRWPRQSQMGVDWATGESVTVEHGIMPDGRVIEIRRVTDG